MGEHDEIIRLLRQIEKEAYERGYQAGIDAVTAAARNIKTPTASPSPAPTPPRKRARKGATVSAVRNIINETPGLSGVEVVRKATEADRTISERTVRTSLRRLRLDGEIEQRERRWYPKETTLEDVNDILFSEENAGGGASPPPPENSG